MSPANRQRFIGFGLLLLLLVILVPWALQEPPAFILDRDTTAPDELQIDWSAPSPVVGKEKLEATRDDIAQQRRQVLEANEAENQLLAFALALETFARKADAQAMRQQLNDAGYAAYVRDTTAGFALFAGPEISRKQLDRLRDKLAADSRFDFSSFDTVRYLP